MIHFSFLCVLSSSQPMISCGSGWRWTRWWTSSLCRQCLCQCIWTGAGWVSNPSPCPPSLSLPNSPPQRWSLGHQSVPTAHPQWQSLRLPLQRWNDQTGGRQGSRMMMRRQRRMLGQAILLKWRPGARFVVTSCSLKGWEMNWNAT